MKSCASSLSVLAAILLCSTGVARAQPNEVVVSFQGRMDGSDRIEITSTHAHWTHLNWEWPPEPVVLNGIKWNPKEQGSLVNHGGTRFLPSAVDFRSARLQKVQGRDTVVLERHRKSMVVYINDTPNGSSVYKFEIALRPPLARTKLRVVAEIDGSDQLHLNGAGARWVHRHWDWPSKVYLNQVAWNPRKSRRLNNAGETTFLEGPVDFASAKMTVKQGRDLAVLEHTKNGLIIHFADNPLGKATYDLTISFGE